MGYGISPDVRKMAGFAGSSIVAGIVRRYGTSTVGAVRVRERDCCG